MLIANILFPSNLNFVNEEVENNQNTKSLDLNTKNYDISESIRGQNNRDHLVQNINEQGSSRMQNRDTELRLLNNLNNIENNDEFNVEKPEIGLDTVIIIESPGDTSISESYTDYILEWQGQDENEPLCGLSLSCSSPESYQIEQNDTIIKSGSWNSTDETITIQVAQLMKGIYKFNLTLFDDEDNFISDVIYLTVTDSTGPNILVDPSNFQYAEGSTGNTIHWEFNDTYPDKFVIYQNEIELTSSTWESGVPIIQNIDGLVKGVYNFTISVNDTSNNIITNQVEVDVIDDQQPIFSEFPSNQTIEYLVDGNQLQWTIDETYSDSYVIYRNNQTLENGSYEDDEQISISLDDLPVGIYNYTLYANDTSGNLNIHMVNITVIDSTAPTINSIDDFTVEDGTSRPVLNWSVEDHNPSYYLIYENELLITNSTWSNFENITYTIDHLDLGLFNVTVIVFDQYGNQNEDTTIVNIQDTIAPSVENLNSSFTFDESEIEQELIWSISDVNTGNYDIYENSSKILSSSFQTTGTISISIDNLDIGVYNYTLVATDIANNINSSTVIITVYDITTPQNLDPFSYFTYSFNTSNNFLELYVEDSYPDFYEYYINGTYNDTSSWDSENPTIVNVDGFSIGNHSLSFIFSDTSNNNLTIDITLEIKDVPVFTEFPTNTFFNETISNEITWKLSSNDPDWYILYHNDSQIQSNSWINNQNISINLDSYDLGYHNFTIFINDTRGEIAISSIIILITDIPQIDIFPSNQNIAESIGYSDLTWEAFDDMPDTFELFVNNTLIHSGDWLSIINYNLTDLTLGLYQIRLLVYDVHDNLAIQEFNITIFDQTLPELLLSGTSTVEYRSNSYFTIDISDNHPSYYLIYHNGSLIHNSTWIDPFSSNFSVHNYELGQHNFTIYSYDTSGNFVSDEFWIEIIDTTDPVVDYTYSPEINYYEDFEFYFNFSDHFPGYYEIYVNDSLVQTDSWMNQTINNYFASFQFGMYHILLLVYDSNNNIASEEFFLNVEDPILPQITSFPSNTSLNEGDQALFNWKAVDPNPYNYSIYINSTMVEYGTWNNETEIEVNLNNYLKGFYIVNVTFQDLAGNSIYSIIEIRIVDENIPVLIDGTSQQVFPLYQNYIALWWNFTDSHPHVYEIYVNSSIEFEGSWDNEINVNWEPSMAGYYLIELFVYDKDENVFSVTHTIEIVITETTIPTIELVEDVFEGDKQTFTGIWTSVDGNITSSWLNITILNQENRRLQPQFYDLDQGSYNITLDYTNFEVGIYSILIELTSYGYHNISLTHMIEVHPYTVNLSVDYDDELIQNEAFNITVQVTYIRGLMINSNSLQLLEFQPRSPIANDVEVVLILLVQYVDGSPGNLTSTAFTNQFGVVSFIIPAASTKSISSITQFSLAVEQSEFSNAEIKEIENTNFPNIVGTSPNPLYALITWIIGHLFYILAIGLPSLISLISVTFIYLRKRKKDKARQDKFDLAYQTIQAYKSIRLVIFQSNYGIVLSQVTLKTMNIESSLIGGFSSAISSFLEELEDKDFTGFQTIERQGITILSHKTELTSLVVMSDDPIPRHLYSKLTKAHKGLDTKYRDPIVNGSGQQIPMEDFVSVLSESNFDLGLMVSKLILVEENDISYENDKRLNLEEFQLFNMLKLVMRENPKELSYILEYLSSKKVDPTFAAHSILKIHHLGYLKIVSEGLLDAGNPVNLLEATQEPETTFDMQDMPDLPENLPDD